MLQTTDCVYKGKAFLDFNLLELFWAVYLTNSRGLRALSRTGVAISLTWSNFGFGCFSGVGNGAASSPVSPPALASGLQDYVTNIINIINTSERAKSTSFCELIPGYLRFVMLRKLANTRKASSHA